MKYLNYFLFTLLLANASVNFAQNLDSDLTIIREEGQDKSQVMKIISDMCDMYAPRLTGTRQYYKAAEWAKETMEAWGLDKVYFEEYCDDCMGWEVSSFNVEMVEPSYMRILAYPYAWTDASNGTKTAELVSIENYTNLSEVQENWKGKLKGKIVLIGRTPKANLLTEPLTNRFTDERLEEAVQSTSVAPKNPLGPNAGGRSLLELEAFFKTFMEADVSLFKFLKEEGAMAVLGTTPLFPGIIHPSGSYNYKVESHKSSPYFAIAPEHFSKLKRLIDRGISPKIRFHQDSEMYMEPKNNVNIIGEINGSDPVLKDEVVMIGAHFDSWHSGSGATDNGAGSAVMMEVMRILKSAGLKPKRTIRIGLWGGEEQGYLGSFAHAENRFGKIDGAFNKKEIDKISAYLNMDNGAGKMRGIFLQGNEKVRSIFSEMLAPFSEMDVNNLSFENTNMTDHDVFDHYNIPAFQIIQDPLNYFTVTHHTNMDVLEYVPEDDMKINATVIAALVYQIAMRDTKMPRKEEK